MSSKVGHYFANVHFKKISTKTLSKFFLGCLCFQYFLGRTSATLSRSY